jgi:hypothetical protein
MGTLDMLQLVSRMNETPEGESSSVGTPLIEPAERIPLRNRADLIRPMQFTRTRISTPEGLELHALLKSVSRAGIQVLTPVRVPIRCPLKIAIAGCRPFQGEAFYCLKRSTVYQVAIVFASRQKPIVAPGAVATVHSLETPFADCRGSIVDLTSSTVSILCKNVVAPGSRVRLASNDWILFGVVKNVIPTSMIGRLMEVHLEAAFPADPDRQAVAPETIFRISFVAPQTLASPYTEAQEGVEV